MTTAFVHGIRHHTGAVRLEQFDIAIAQPIATPTCTKSPNLIITRIARGLPVGGDLEYADDVTLSQSLEGRRKY